METDKLQQLLDKANKNLRYFICIFLFIHLVIIIPYKHPVDNNAVGEATTTVQQQISTLTASLAHLEKQLNNKPAPSPRNNTPKSTMQFSAAKLPETKVPFKNTKDSLAKADSAINQQIYAVREKLVQYHKAYIEFTEKKTDRAFTIPILGITINESVILTFYPGFILLGLSMALFYRRQLLIFIKVHGIADAPVFSYPVWAAPIPYSARYASLIGKISTNTIGISLHCLFIYLGIDFLLFFFQANRFATEVSAIIIFIGILALVIYLITILQLLPIKWIKTKK